MSSIRSSQLQCLAVMAMTSAFAAASEYHGSVTAHGLAFPGVTVTASRDGHKEIAITDARGKFSFADLADGVWSVEVAMLGFEKLTREVAVAPGAPAPTFELRFLTEAALNRQLGAAQVSAGPSRAPFQRLAVNQAAETTVIAGQGTLRTEEVADLTQSSANSFLVQGSVSSALGMGQMNDWGPLGGGRGMMEPMGGAPGMGPGGNGEPMGTNQAAGKGGGLTGGRGGPGGGMAMGGGRGGPGGGMGGPGGPGGPGGMGGPGGRGGPGGPEGFGGRGGRGGPDWMGRPGSMAFGNNRRNPALSYQAGANFSLDNSVWDARTYSVTGAAIDKPAYFNGRGGVTLGGPLVIPKLVGASKRIMFTLDFNMSRNRTGTNSQPVKVPTGLERIGDFSQSSATILDPLNGLPFPGNIIPANRIDSAAASLLGYYPAANLFTTSQNYQTSWAGSNNSHNLNARLSNIRIATKDRLNFSLGMQGSNNSTPNLFQFVDTGASRAINTGLGWSRNFTTRITNNLQLSFSRQRQQQLPFFAGVENVAASLGIVGTSQNPLNWGPPNLGFNNYASLSDGNASLNRNQTASVGNTLLWVRGTHNLTFGGDYRRQQFNQFADANGRGSFTFNGAVTGYDLADFLLGLPTTSSIRYGNPDKYFRGSGFDAYVNDDWRINPSFSIILGMRWDYGTPVTEKYARLVNLDFGLAYSTVALAQGNSLLHNDPNNFSPRLGFAWRPRTGHSLVLRGGYGLYYNTSVYNTIASNLAQQPPFAQTVNASTSSTNVLTLQNGFVTPTTQDVTNTYAIDPNYRIGYAQSWSLTVQSDLKFGLFGTVGYLATKGTRLDQQFLPNSVAPGAVESIYPHGFVYETSNGNSIYHAAQFQLNRRMRSGLMANASYQFSKSIDNAGTGGRGQGGTPVAQNWLDLSAERGLSSFDARHNLSLQFMYSTGMGRSGGTLLNGWRGKLLKDWNLMSNVSLRSGNPFSATVGGSRSQVSGTAVSGTVRADATGLPVSVDGLLFNTAAFAAPLAGTWGTAGRNTIPGPAVFSLNGSVGRVFRFGERRSVDLQLQAQNILNRVSITSWGTTIDSANYGLATGAAAMRRMTASVRFRF